MSPVNASTPRPPCHPDRESGDPPVPRRPCPPAAPPTARPIRPRPAVQMVSPRLTVSEFRFYFQILTDLSTCGHARFLPLAPAPRRPLYPHPMSQNPPNLRPDLARSVIPDQRRPGQPTIGMVSLGCPKALVDSERILTRLRAEGYAISPRLSGRRRRHREHLRLSRQRQGRKPGGHRRGPGRERQSHRHRLSGGRARLHHRRAPDRAGRDRAAAVRTGPRRRPRRRAAVARPVHRPAARDRRHPDARAITAT